MGNQGSGGKFKQRGGDSVQQELDPLHPANFRKTRSFRKGSDADSGSGAAKSDIVSMLPRRFSGLSPTNLAKHKRNVSDVPLLRASPKHAGANPTESSTLSTNSTFFKNNDSDSEASLVAVTGASDGIFLDTRDVSDVSEPSSATMRQYTKEKKYLAEASEIRPWLFLGGMEVAKQKDYLRSLGITHVLNCAHTVCENYHEKDFKYVRPIDIHDTSNEDILSFMLQAIADIEAVREVKGRILVHCQLGSSRSATLVIAYLMWLDGIDETKAFQEVRKLRGIVSPNFGFMVQLKEFKRRLEWRPTEPSLHRIVPYSASDGALVVKTVVHADNKLPVVPTVAHLDPRGTFLLHSPKDRTMFLWVGPDVGIQAESEAKARRAARESGSTLRRVDSPPLRETYEQAGKRFGRIMCRYEKAFRDENGNPCQFVIVPTDQSAVLALADGADQNSCAAKFWKTLGESVGTKTGIETLRANRSTSEWTEAEDSKTVAYMESVGASQFAVFDITPSDRSLLSDTSQEVRQ